MSYSPNLGRWIEVDPEQYVDGNNLYQYVSSRPLRFTDPNGTASFDHMPDPSEGPVFTPVGEAGLRGVAFLQWVRRIPKGVAKYSFQWGTYQNNQDLTGIGVVKGAAIRGPGENPGKSEYYFAIEEPTNFWLLNLQLGATGRNYTVGKAPPEYEDYDDYLKTNDGKNTFGWASLSLEVRSDCGDIQGDRLGDGNYNQTSFNNANRLFFPGGILDISLAGNGLEPPPGWGDAERIFYASANVRWYKGAVNVDWYVDAGGKPQFDSFSKTL